MVKEPGPWVESVNIGESWVSNLTLAKCRVTPVARLTIPWSEANALLTAHKMAEVCLRAVKEKP